MIKKMEMVEISARANKLVRAKVKNMEALKKEIEKQCKKLEAILIILVDATDPTRDYEYCIYLKGNREEPDFRGRDVDALSWLEGVKFVSEREK